MHTLVEQRDTLYISPSLSFFKQKVILFAARSIRILHTFTRPSLSGPFRFFSVRRLFNLESRHNLSSLARTHET